MKCERILAVEYLVPYSVIIYIYLKEVDSVVHASYLHFMYDIFRINNMARDMQVHINSCDGVLGRSLLLPEATYTETFRY